MSILLLGDFDAGEEERWLASLREAMPQEVIASAAARVQRDSVEIAIVANPPPEALSGLPGLGLIQSLWAGVERLLEDPTVPADVPIARMVDPLMTAAMGETALWAVLGLQRGFFTYAQQQRGHRWEAHPQVRASQTPVGVLGLGTMGCAVAARLAAQGFPVRGWSLRRRAPSSIETFSGAEGLAAVLGASQIVVNLLPSTPATRGLLDATRLAQMPRGSALVNLGRGAQLIEPDLLAALDSGQLRHAVLDVFAVEPLPSEHPFWAHPGVTVLPHVAAQTDFASAAAVAAANVRRWRAGLAVEHLVDRQRGY